MAGKWTHMRPHASHYELPCAQVTIVTSGNGQNPRNRKRDPHNTPPEDTRPPNPIPVHMPPRPQPGQEERHVGWSQSIPIRPPWRDGVGCPASILSDTD